MRFKEAEYYNYKDAIQLCRLKGCELIYSNDICRIIIDIDKNVNHIDEVHSELRYFRQFLYNTINIQCKYDDSYILLQCNSGQNKYRVVFPHLVDSFSNIGRLINMYCEKFKNEMFDTSIYTKQRYLRPMNTEKPGSTSNRIYKYEPNGVLTNVYATLIDTHYYNMNLNNIFEYKPYFKTIYNNNISSLDDIKNSFVTTKDISDLILQIDPDSKFILK